MRGRGAGETARAQIEASIEILTAEQRRPPTVREIGEHAGIASTGHLSYHLRILEERGVIARVPGTSRGIMLTRHVAAATTPRAADRLPHTISLRGRIAAGEPIEAVEDVDETVDLGWTRARRDEELYALRVSGTSMIEDLIADGDVVVVRRQDTADDGDTVVALLLNGQSATGEVTLKRFYREPDGRVRLQPANSTLAPLLVDAGDVRIQGTVVAVVRDV